eukprot:1722118-Amphidinium_carterae.2
MHTCVLGLGLKVRAAPDGVPVECHVMMSDSRAGQISHYGSTNLETLGANHNAMALQPKPFT